VGESQLVRPVVRADHEPAGAARGLSTFEYQTVKLSENADGRDPASRGAAFLREKTDRNPQAQAAFQGVMAKLFSRIVMVPHVWISVWGARLRRVRRGLVR